LPAHRSILATFSRWGCVTANLLEPEQPGRVCEKGPTGPQGGRPAPAGRRAVLSARALLTAAFSDQATNPQRPGPKKLVLGAPIALPRTRIGRRRPMGEVYKAQASSPMNRYRGIEGHSQRATSQFPRAVGPFSPGISGGRPVDAPQYLVLCPMTAGQVGNTHFPGDGVHRRHRPSNSWLAPPGKLPIAEACE